MSKLAAVLWCSSLAAADLAQLQALTESKRLFELRRELQQPESGSADTLFYRGIAASRFGHEKDGLELLRAFLATKPDLNMLRRVREEMAEAYERLGLYKDAAEAWTEALELIPAGDPEREENENTQALMVSLSEAMPETIDFGTDVPIKATRNKLGVWDVPVQVNHFTGQWIFDTGAGGAIQIRVEVVPALRFEILGMPLNLKKVSMLPEQPKGENRFRDGVIGMDALWNGFQLDFHAMRPAIQ